jgi:hypothetical protein
MREIPLSRGLVALVEDEDYEDVSQWKWYAKKFGRGQLYAVRKLSRKDHPEHRQGFLSMHRYLLKLDKENPLCADHINGKTLDNRRSNLRTATRAENNRNCARRYNNKTGIKGVTLYRGRRWCATISHEGKTIHLGYFDTKEEAKARYNEKAKELFGAFARLN